MGVSRRTASVSADKHNIVPLCVLVNIPGKKKSLNKRFVETSAFCEILFNELVLSDKLFEHCAEIDEAARNRMELIVPELAKRNGVTEKLKADTKWNGYGR